MHVVRALEIFFKFVGVHFHFAFVVRILSIKESFLREKGRSTFGMDAINILSY